MRLALLQFTNAATVPGVAGQVDCSAFRGTPAQLRDQLLPNESRPATEDLMQPGFLLSGAGAVTPLAIPNGAKRLRFFSNRPAQVTVNLIGVSEPTSTLTLGYEHGAQGVATGGALAAVVHRVDDGDNEVSYVVTGLPAPGRRHPRVSYGRTSCTRLNGVSEARRNLVNPTSVTTCSPRCFRECVPLDGTLFTRPVLRLARRPARWGAAR